MPVPFLSRIALQWKIVGTSFWVLSRESPRCILLRMVERVRMRRSHELIPGTDLLQSMQKNQEMLWRRFSYYLVHATVIAVAMTVAGTD